MKAHNLFCIEGDWWGNLKKSSSVKPVFDLISQMEPSFRTIHRMSATRGEFDHYLRIWSQRRHADYPILYVAFHGSSGCVHVGDGRRRECQVDLDQLGKLLHGRCDKRVIHFGSCSTLKCDRRRIQRFLQTTGAVAISGYTTDVDWLDSAAFEVFWLYELQQRTMIRTGVRAVERRIHERVRTLSRALGFRLVVRD